MLKQIYHLIFITLLSIILAACGGGGSGNGAGGGIEPIGDLKGIWSVSEEIDNRSCTNSANLEYDNYSLSVASSVDNSVTVSDNKGTYTGALNGNILSWKGSYPNDGGIVQALVNLTITSSCNSLAGSASWSWSDGVTSCSGTTKISASREDPTGCGLPPALSSPEKPAGFNVSKISSSSVTLSWQDVANEANFVIQRSEISGSGYKNIQISKDSTSYTDTGLKPSTTYYYRIYATNKAGDSASSNEVIVMTQSAGPSDGTAPNSPSALNAITSSSTEISLSWSDNSADETKFIVERSTAETSGFSVIASNLVANTTSYSSTDLVPNTRYYYRVKAANTYGTSAASSIVYATTYASSGAMDYTFTGGTIDDLRAVNSTLTFNNLMISGILEIPASETNVALTVNDLTFDAGVGKSGVLVVHTNCRYRNAPNLTVNATGNVIIRSRILLKGKDGAASLSSAACLRAKGTNGGDLTINASKIDIDARIATTGGNSSTSSLVVGGQVIRTGKIGGDGGNINLNATGQLTLTSAGILEIDGGSGGFGNDSGTQTKARNGYDGELIWKGAPINVTEASTSPNIFYSNAQPVTYETLTLKGQVGYRDDPASRGNDGVISVTIEKNNINIKIADIIEDLYEINLKLTKNISITLTSQDTSANLDLYLFRIVGTSITVVASSNTESGIESISHSLLPDGKYYLGVSYYDYATYQVTTGYTINLE